MPGITNSKYLNIKFKIINSQVLYELPSREQAKQRVVLFLGSHPALLFQ